jgi:hypothetical protein
VAESLHDCTTVAVPATAGVHSVAVQLFASVGSTGVQADTEVAA